MSSVRLYRSGAAIVGVITISTLIYETMRSKPPQLISSDLQHKIEALHQVKRKQCHSTPSTTIDDYMSARAESSDGSDSDSFYDCEDEATQGTGARNATVRSSKRNMKIMVIDRHLDSASVDCLDGALDKLRELRAEDPNNEGILWRIGKACKLRSSHSTDEVEIRRYLEEGIEACTHAVELSEPTVSAYKWLAILYAFRCKIQPLKDQLMDSNLFKIYLDIAICLEPEDANSRFLNGRYLYALSQLTWWESSMAKVFFNTLPTVTVKEALDEFLLAERLWTASTANKDIRLYIAKCYVVLGQQEQVQLWLRKANEAEYIEEKETMTEIQELSKRYL